MTKKNCIGIHYTDAEITAVLIEQHQGRYNLAAEWKVSAKIAPTNGKPDNTGNTGNTESLNEDSPYCQATDEEKNSLITQLRQTIVSRYEKIPQIALTLGGQLYQTHAHHSPFSDAQQFSQTLRYDIEDDLATDADSIALSYQQRTSPSSGSDLLVQTVNREQLQNILDEFETLDMDALIAMPDSASWLRFLQSQTELPSQKSVVVLAWAAEILYIMALNEEHQPILIRTLPCNCRERGHEMLSYELPRSLATLAQDQQPNRLLYHSGSLDEDKINDLAQRCNLKPQKLTEPDMAVACAAGAAIASLEQNATADFRADAMPPRTVTTARRRAYYGLAAAVSFFMLVCTLIMNLHSAKFLSREEAAFEEMKAAYKIACPRQKLPRMRTQISRAIRRRLSDVEKKYSDRASTHLPDSAGNMLMLFFGALNNLPEDFDLKIDTLTFDAKSVMFTGSVPDLQRLEQLRSAIVNPDSKLQIDRAKFDIAGSGSKKDPTSRRTFSMPLRTRL